MVLLNLANGAAKSEQEFQSNFNLFLPHLLIDCDKTDTACEKKKKDLMVRRFKLEF